MKRDGESAPHTRRRRLAAVEVDGDGGLLARGEVSHDTRTNVGAFLQHMSLFFVPAGVGVMVHLQRVANEWLPIVVSLVVSTFAGMAVTAWVIRAMSPKKGSASTEEARP